jgi:hypothetical protein
VLSEAVLVISEAVIVIEKSTALSISGTKQASLPGRLFSQVQYGFCQTRVIQAFKL